MLYWQHTWLLQLQALGMLLRLLPEEGLAHVVPGEEGDYAHGLRPHVLCPWQLANVL